MSDGLLSFFSVIVGVFLASLVGSLHCVGMCGGFVALYSCGGGRDKQGSKRQRMLAHVGYHSGRLVSYLTLGVFAGALGQAMFGASAWLESRTVLGFQRYLAIVLGVSMVLWALVQLRVFNMAVTAIKKQSSQQSSGVTWFTKRGFQWANFGASLFQSSQRIVGALANTEGAAGPFLIGLCSVLLPCGWLYSYVFIAALSASPLVGPVIMLAFWLGTIPALLGFGLLLQPLGLRFRAWVPRASALLVLSIGLLTIWGKYPVYALDSKADGAKAMSPTCPHHRVMSPK